MGARNAWPLALGLVGAGLVLVGAGLVLSGRGASSPFDAAALGAMAGGGASGVLVSATPLGDNEVVICLVDTERQRLVVYLADGKRSRMRLLAARDIAADWSLTDYNNDPPLPKDVRARAEKSVSDALRSGPAAGGDARPQPAP